MIHLHFHLHPIQSLQAVAFPASQLPQSSVSFLEQSLQWLVVICCQCGLFNSWSLSHFDIASSAPNNSRLTGHTQYMT